MGSILRYELFRDRADAGNRLAEHLALQLLSRHTGCKGSMLILGLPRGGVVVAEALAARLGLPLDVWGVRKVGAPLAPEVGVGAVAEGGEVFLSPEIMALAGTQPAEVQREVDCQLIMVREHVKRYRRGRSAPEVRGRSVLLVDDGIASGGTVLAAVRALRKRGAERILVAAPIASSEADHTLRRQVDGVVCLHVDPHLAAIGAWYRDYSPVSDLEVTRILDRRRRTAVPEERA